MAVARLCACSPKLCKALQRRLCTRVLASSACQDLHLCCREVTPGPHLQQCMCKMLNRGPRSLGSIATRLCGGSVGHPLCTLVTLVHPATPGALPQRIIGLHGSRGGPPGGEFAAGPRDALETAGCSRGEALHRNCLRVARARQTSVQGTHTLPLQYATLTRWARNEGCKHRELSAFDKMGAPSPAQMHCDK